ncbi:MAG: bacillithiol biosynthesis cysteine-adding enzyme BshC [Candidatus Acidiferrales bacterium]
MTTLMETHCISFREIPQTTKLFATFLEDFGRVARYYGHLPSIAGVAAAAKEVRLDPEVRRGVVEVLREQNLRFGGTAELDPETARNLERLANGAVAIVTGQQVGLFTAPAYSFYKAMTAAAYAQELTRQGIEAVPVFWVATEDHDLAEINHAAWTTRTGLAEFAMPVGEGEEGRRVGEITLGAAIAAPVVTAVDTLEGPYAGDVARALRESYTPDETYGSAYAKLVARLVAGRGIILLDPLDARLHRFAAGVYRRALDEADSLRDALLARSKELERGGFHAQVKVARESTLLFYNVDGLRQPLRQRNGKFFAGSATFTAEELRAAIERAPEAFTPNVLLRPVVQDTLLPTAAYIGGPAEIAYMAQAQLVYQQLLGRMPAMLPRASFTIIEQPIARLLKKYGLNFRDMLRGRQYLRARMEVQSLPRGLGSRFEKDEKSLRKLLEAYRKPLERLDGTLKGALALSERKMLHQFLNLKRKAGRAENFRTGVLDRHERMLIDALYPHRGLQERTLSALPWLAAYGPEFLDDIAELSAVGVSGAESADKRSANPTPCAHQHHVLFT